MKTKEISERRYDVDWIRIMLFFSVFLFHIGMFFNDWGWHIKDNERIHWLNPIMSYLHAWRMPLLFMISGMGTFYAIGKRGILQFTGERSRRLLIPLIFGMFFIVPPQVYIEKQSQYGSYWNFLPHLAQGSYPTGNLSWHHLWFILYLFICAMAAIPFITFLKSKASNKFYSVIEKVSEKKGIFLILIIPLYIAQKYLLNYFPKETHAFVNDWAYMCNSFLYFIFGYLLISSKKLIQNLSTQRRIYGSIALVITILFFSKYFNSINEEIKLFIETTGVLTISFAILGYANKYINRDHPWRKYLNEAVYPFYILHQTVIIIVASYLMNSAMNVSLKALIITIGSFSIIAILYVFVIRPFNVMRLLFGMKFKSMKISDKNKKEEIEVKEFIEARELKQDNVSVLN